MGAYAVAMLFSMDGFWLNPNNSLGYLNGTSSHPTLGYQKNVLPLTRDRVSHQSVFCSTVIVTIRPTSNKVANSMGTNSWMS
jgi:hypothetical protein